MAYLLKYYTFSAKIKTLSEFHTRISSNQQIPSNAEVITTLRYFQQTLISFLKDVPKEKYYILKKYASDISRQSVFPNLNYSGLFYGLINLLDVFTQIPSGHQAIGEAILDVFRPLYLFLERENLDQLPYAISSQLGVFPDELAKKLMHVLCDCIMPYLLTDDGAGEPNVPILLLMVLQYNKNRSLHTMALESLMRLKSNIYADVISVIAKGSSESRITAANLLFHYWPINNPTILHRKQIQYRVQAWSPVKCQNLNCSDKAPSIKVCYNPTVSAKYGDLSPPIFLCKSCASDIQTDVPMKFIQQPMPAANTTICQNKGCESSNRMAVGTCFDEDCIRSHSFVPLRLCQECITCLHENQQKTHKKHTSITNIWGSDYEFIMIEAIVKLLKETSYQLESTEGDVKRPKWLRQLEAGQTIGTDVDTMSDERKMLSRFGIWIMAALCPPTKEASKESVGYILAMLFQWFTTTALLPNDSMGSQLEQLKVDFVSDWVHMAITHHYDVFIQILSPILPEYGKVGGAWDKMCNKKEQMKEGLSKLLALMPYDIINLESWNTLMPLWLQAISQEIGDEDINDLKVLLCKIFEPDLCPLPFEIEKVYGFISSRLAHGDKDDILNALQWVHLLSRMDIAISMHMLLDMLTACVQQLVKCKYFIKQGSELEGINELQEIENSDDLDDAEPFVSPLVSQVIITDILMQQMELNEITNENAKKISDKLFCMAAMLLDYPTCDINDADGTVKNGHTCQNPDTDQFADCSLCQETVFFYQILVTLTSKIAPLRELDICTVEIEAYPANDQLLTESFNKNSKTSSVFSPQSHETNALNASMVSNVSNALNQANILTPHSGTSEFASVLPSDVIEPSNAQPFSIVEEQFSNAVIRTETAQIIDDLKTSTVSDPCPAEDDYANKEFWDTSVGKFKFKLSALPAELQLIFNLLKNIDREINPDVQYYLLKTLNYLCLHCEALVNSRRDQRGFLIWLQENLLIPKLYQLLRSDYSQVGQISVKLLIHAVTLPYGEEIFWNIVNNDYINDDWKVRFKAVERVFVLAHLVSPSPIRSSKILQTTLSCAFCHLIVSANDPNTAVSQRAILSIQALPATCLQIIGLCLESQFDSCILDRPLIVQRFQLLTQLVPDESFLTWDFFIQRFETLALESQLKNQGEETTYVQDFLHTDPSSDLYQKKLNKARKSLHEAENVRSIVKSLRENSLRHQLSNIVKQEDDPLENSPGSKGNGSDNLSTGKGGGKKKTYGERLREFTDEESNLCLLLNRVVDIQNPERHTVYLIISLFCDFLCSKKMTSDEKSSAKKQSMLLRHFNTLLGYSHSEKCFTVPPARLRKSVVCNSFLSGLPEILDCNLLIGNQMLLIIVQLLLHLPSPQEMASDASNAQYSIALLSPLVRQEWLNTLILILYKYRFDNPPVSDIVLKLISIVISTIDLQCHSCSSERPNNDPIIDWSDYSDDSGVSDADEGNNIIGTDTIMEEAEDGSCSYSYDAHHKTSKVSVVIEPSPNERYSLSRPSSLTGIAAKSKEGLTMDDKIESIKNRPPNYKKKKELHKRIKKSKSIVTEKSKDELAEFRCGNCNEILKNFDEESLSLCIIALETFSQREPTMAAPILFRIITSVSKFIETPLYPWHESTLFVPGNSRSTAKQLLRVIFHQINLATEGTGGKISSELKCSIIIMKKVMKVQNFSTFKCAALLVEGYSKWLAEALHHAKIDLIDLLGICTACNRALIRERDKQYITRAVVTELIQAIKFKVQLHNDNYMKIVDLILQDTGELVSVEITDDQYNTGASDAVKPYINDILEFVSDYHVLSRLKKQTNNDSVGGDLKAGLAKIVAVEMSRTSGKDNRPVTRYIPWLLNPPNITQAAPGAFAESVTNVRIVSWLLLGALHSKANCLPIPIENSNHIADYIHFVLVGFADQSSQSITTMSGLFHAAHLCQIWTVYCEQRAITCNASDLSNKTMNHILEFWSRVTPAILQLLSHSKVLADMVNLHFVNTLQALQQVNSAVLCQLYPMWQPMLTAYHHAQIPSQLRKKLEACENQPSLKMHNILDWVKQVRYKIGQIELQTSAASPFYNV
uniref:Protein unc-79 homolog n=1 Tax=Rhabditophanes sp. KR3021 TaxID=114890 RepID=A0AC35TMA7_9BILA